MFPGGRLIAAAAVAAALGVCASPAAGAGTDSFIVYSCGSQFVGERKNICSVESNGLNGRQITTDGGTGDRGVGYDMPSESRDGSRLAFAFGDTIFSAAGDTSQRVSLVRDEAIGSVRISPDGTRVLYSTWRDNVPTLWEIPAAGGQPRWLADGGSSGDWVSDGVVAAVGYPQVRGGLCLLTTGSRECERFFTSEGTAKVTDPAVSPDGKLVAAAVESVGVVLYDTASGGRVRLLAGDPLAAHPSWSPNGREVVYEADGDLYIVGLGRESTPQLLTYNGDTPTWVGREGTARPRLTLRAHMRGSRLQVAGDLARGAAAPVRLEFRADQPRNTAIVSRIFHAAPARGRFHGSVSVRRLGRLEYCSVEATYAGDAHHARQVVRVPHVVGGRCHRDFRS